MAATLLPLDLGLVMGLVMVWPVLALALAFRLLSFPDLTVEGSFALGAASFATAIANGWPLWVGVTAAILGGALLGAITAAIHVWLHLNKFLAGIITVAMSYTLCLRLMDAPNIGLLRDASLFDVAAPLDQRWPGLQVGTMLLLAVAIGAGLTALRLASTSTLGLKLRAVGSNPDYGRALGLSTGLYLVTGLGLTNALAALGGVALASLQGFADVGMGQGALILALASLTIGERLVPERRLSIAGFVLAAALAGAIVYQVIAAYALYVGLAPSDLKLATALFVLMIVALRRERRDDPFVEGLQ